MLLKLDADYLSLTPFYLEIPDFVVLTGVNGAGKTHLLQGIASGSVKLLDEDQNVLNNPTVHKVKYVHTQQLVPGGNKIITSAQVENEAKKAWQQYDRDYVQPFRRVNIPKNDQRDKRYSQIAIKAKKDIKKLLVEDFLEFYSIIYASESEDIFYAEFSFLFKAYIDKYLDNKFNKFLRISEGFADQKFYSDNEFVEIFGPPPWELIDNILREAGLPFFVVKPNAQLKSLPYELKLINIENKIEINFTQLSSGEKTLMSLILSLYNAKNNVEFPSILLLDEPDASLHPSMCRQFLSVIQEVFVREKKMKVIVTTHSPSTVALTAEENLFVMNKFGKRIEKASKDGALKILTAGVPSFSVNYENRRQIFVESPNDVSFYERIYRLLVSELAPEVSLSFISSGDTRTDKNGKKIANCGQVENITRTLRDSGNKFVWGIIDFDAGNKGSEYMKVLGKGNRYSIENYLLDPLLVVGLLLREKLIKAVEIGLEDNYSYSDFLRVKQEMAQLVIDEFVRKVEAKMSGVRDKNPISVSYINGLEVSIPKWYLDYNGHDLEEKVLCAFPGLNKIKRDKEEALKLAVIEKVLDDIPGLISVDFLAVFKEIQEI